VLTKDGYEVNIGILVERRPLLLKANKADMEALKAHYQWHKKYNLLPSIPHDVFDFQWQRPKNDTDEIPTHMR